MEQKQNEHEANRRLYRPTAPQTGTFPNFTPSFTDTSIIVTWSPVPKFSYKVLLSFAFRHNTVILPSFTAFLP